MTETSNQDGPELYNPTTKAYALQSNYDVDGNWCITQGDMISSSVRSDELLAKQVGENRMTIQRYIRLTNLIPKVLDMVDEGKIAFTLAVELSYLTEEQQYELYEVMDIEQCTPSLSQANRMKRMSQSESLDMDAMFSILDQEKPNQREQIKLRTDSVAKYFPEDYTPKQKTDLIERLLKEWYEKQEREKKQGSDRYRYHIRLGQLQIKAKEVNKEAYEMLDRIVERYLAKHKPKDKHSAMKMWKIREQAKMLAEEVIYGEIVYQYH